MRESKEYKKAQEKTVLDVNEIFIEGYEDCYETHKQFLEWQKPEDVELVDDTMYLMKRQIKIFPMHYNDEISIVIYSNGNWFHQSNPGEPIEIDNEVLIKQIEV